MENIKKAIGYIRVSTDKQSQDDKFGIEVQKEGILAYALENGYEIVDWEIDIMSGVSDNRPSLDKILYKPEELPPHNAVIVFKNDRVARDTKLYFYYFYTLEKRSVSLLSAEEQFDEGDAFANVYRSLLMFVAEQERKNISLRTSKGRNVKAQSGAYSGGNKPYGYKVEDGALVIDKREKPIVQKVFMWYNDGESLVKISEMLEKQGYRTRKGGKFQSSTIKSIINNKPFYEGNYKYGDVGWVKGTHSPIL